MRDRIAVPQNRETSGQVITQGFMLRHAYARSADSQAAGEVGQDYLTVGYGPGCCCFALCDGVSQSFYGDLAARFLGDALLDWLWALAPDQLGTGPLEARIGRCLQELTLAGRAAVQTHPLPADLSPLVRHVLEQKRALGSEAMFVCGRLDLPGPDFPDGRLVASCLGDSRLRLWGPSGEQTQLLSGSCATAQRWSTHRGAVGGAPHVWVMPLRRGDDWLLTRLVAYSDGLSLLDGAAAPLSPEALQAVIAEAGQSALSDDIAFLELTWPMKEGETPCPR